MAWPSLSGRIVSIGDIMNLCVVEKTVIRHYRVNRMAHSPEIPFTEQVKPNCYMSRTIEKVRPDIKAALNLIVATNALALSALFRNIAELF